MDYWVGGQQNTNRTIMLYVTVGIFALVCSLPITLLLIDLCYFFRPFAQAEHWSAIRELFTERLPVNSLYLAFAHGILALAALWGFYGIGRGIESRNHQDRLLHAGWVTIGLVGGSAVCRPRPAQQ